jgi:hypothetical protein
MPCSAEDDPLDGEVVADRDEVGDEEAGELEGGVELLDGGALVVGGGGGT